MSDGHSDAGAGVERETDPRDVTDDGEIELNLPREDTEEWDRPREDIREFSGVTASGTTAASQEERYRLELPNGARPKWSLHELPLHNIEEPRSPGMGATVNRGGPGTDPSGMGERPRFYQHFNRTDKVPGL